MQKVVYISNSRDYTEQNDINDNKYLTPVSYTHLDVYKRQVWKRPSSRCT